MPSPPNRRARGARPTAEGLKRARALRDASGVATADDARRLELEETIGVAPGGTMDDRHIGSAPARRRRRNAANGGAATRAATADAAIPSARAALDRGGGSWNALGAPRRARSRGVEHHVEPRRPAASTASATERRAGAAAAGDRAARPAPRGARAHTGRDDALPWRRGAPGRPGRPGRRSSPVHQPGHRRRRRQAARDPRSSRPSCERLPAASTAPRQRSRPSARSCSRNSTGWPRRSTGACSASKPASGAARRADARAWRMRPAGFEPATSRSGGARSIP